MCSNIEKREERLLGRTSTNVVLHKMILTGQIAALHLPLLLEQRQLGAGLDSLL
jgi:hypothetical protein